MTNPMKRFLLSVIIFILSIACYGQEVASIEFIEFKNKGDSLHISYRLQALPKKTLSGEGVFIELSIESGDFVSYLPHIVLLGKNKRKVLERYQKKNDYIVISSNSSQDEVYSIAVPYKDWMNAASLNVRQETAIYRGKKIVTSYKIALGLQIKDSTPYKPVLSYLLPLEEGKCRKEEGKAILDFRAGESFIDFSYKNNSKEFDEIKETIAALITNTDTQITGIHITGYASPEGKYYENEQLARVRALSARNYLKKSFSLDSKLFSTSYVAEDWDGLVDLIKPSSLQHKDEVLKIISSVGIHEGRETDLMNLRGGRPYLFMVKEFSPQLCRVEYSINYTVRDYSFAETQNILESSSYLLSHLELYTLAETMDKSSDKYTNIMLNVIPRQFRDDPIANNNAAALLLEQGDVAAASTYLENMELNAAGLNNWGVYHLLQDNFSQAESFFKRAESIGSEDAIQNLIELYKRYKKNQQL